jgi:Cu/Ag efflux protein CusF
MFRTVLKVSSVTLLTVGVLFLAACQSSSPPAKRYPLQGEVISVDAPHQLVTVKHGDIPGLMSAMTMQYMAAEAKQLEAVHPGDKISAELVIPEDKPGQLEKIVVLQKASPTTTAAPSAPTATQQ